MGRNFAAAAALALGGLNDSLPVDFLHSRLAPPKKQLLPRAAVLGIAAGVLLVAVVIYALVDLHAQQTHLAETRAHYEVLKRDVKTADADIAKITYAKAWKPAEPRFRTCLNDLAAALRSVDRLYSMQFNLHADMSGSLSVKIESGDEGPLVPLLTRSKRFTNVRSNMSRADGGQKGTFSINFNYVPPR